MHEHTHPNSSYCNTLSRWVLFSELSANLRYEVNFHIASLGRISTIFSDDGI